MKNKIYALLVGIDAYHSPVPALHGCVNDIVAIEKLLRVRLASDRFNVEIQVLKDREATRQAIIDGFRNHLCRATKDDIVLFYYSGHGSQEQAPSEFWHLEPDRLNETLVCYDSRFDDHYDLADKELAQLLAEVSEKNPQTLVVLDCCHSGSGTRAGDDVGIRRAITDRRARPLDRYLMTLAQVEAGRASTTIRNPFLLPKSRHVVFSACQDNEEAREITIAGERRGVFSYYLTKTLQQYGASLSYRDVFKRVNALVRAHAATQSPMIEATETDDLSLPFLANCVTPQGRYFTASYDRGLGWVIDGGAIHGIPEVVGNETTYLALFPVDVSADQLKQLDMAIGKASVSERLPTRSKITLSFDTDHLQTYKAIVTGLPLPPLGVKLEGDDTGVMNVRRELAKAGLEGGSLLVGEVCDNSELILTARPDGYRIRRSGESQPLAVDIEGGDQEAVHKAINRLEHMARWIRIVELANPSSQLAQDAVRLEIFDEDNNPLEFEGSELRFAYRFEDGKWHQPFFRIKLTNTTDQRLFCMLLDLPETFSVSEGLLPGGGIWLDKKQEAWAYSGKPIPASIPDKLWNAGMIEIRDLLKLIVSTEECDATLLNQGDLDVALDLGRAARCLPPMHTLNRLMYRVQTRHFGGDPEPDEKFVDWVTSEVMITTVRPRENVWVPAEGNSIELSPGVSIIGHPNFKAGVRLTSASFANRSTETMALPPLLRDHPEIVQPLSLSASRSGESGLSVVELFEVEDASAVTADQPLRLRVDDILDEDVCVLPVARDGELFLPLGTMVHAQDGFDIILQRLPDPKPEDARSLHGSICIYLEKIIVQRLGREFRYPLLTSVKPGPERLQRLVELAAIRQQVAAANRIVLFIHGIIGDTEDMAASVFNEPNPLADHYDLVLAFDYENLGTPIEETARDLKQQLCEVGLESGHRKTLHVVAHSMGGLVARWFIEREGGHEIVNRLVMLGTPNAGSPWPTLADWAATTLSIGLNSLGVAIWPARFLGKLVTALGRVDVTLDQMAPGSETLKTLAASPDPKVPYRVLAGNTGLLVSQESNSSDALLARLLARISPRRLLHDLTAPVFFGAPNDIAVSVQSIEYLPAEREPRAEFVELACDHITYFSTAVGQLALRRGLE